MSRSDCWRCLGAQLTSGLFCPQTSSFAHQQHFALWHYLLPSSFVCAAPPQKHSLHQHCAARGARHPPAPWHPAARPWAGCAHPPLCPCLGGTPGPWHALLWFILSGRAYWAHITFFGSVCTLLVLNSPHHLPTKALWRQCLFPIAHLGKSGEENQLGLCWWKSGPDFLQPAKPTVTQERQSWLHANLIVRLLNGFKWV